jgi:uncharacterized protein
MKHLLAVLLVVLAITTSNAHAATPLKIVVYGGTGHIGQRIVREALSRGHEVTVVVRDPVQTPAQSHLRFSRGDVLDSAQIARTIAGHNVVVCAVRVPGPDYERAATSLVAALRSLGSHAPYLIVVGGAGSLEESPGVLVIDHIPPQYRGEVLGQKQALDYYRTVSDVRWTYLSPAKAIQPGERTGKFRLGDDRVIANAQGDSRISMEDYALAVIDEAEQPAHVRRRFTIGY